MSMRMHDRRFRPVPALVWCRNSKEQHEPPAANDAIESLALPGARCLAGPAFTQEPETNAQISDHMPGTGTGNRP